MFDSEESVASLHLLFLMFALCDCRVKHIASILILSRKVVCISFQESYHDYVTSTRNLLPFTLSIPPTGQLVVLYIRALD